MNKLYKKIAEAIRMNTLKNRFNTIEVIDKDALIEALNNHFSYTDCLFIPKEFTKACNEDSD